MISASYITVTHKDLTSNHIHYKTDDATKLLVIFPGGNSSCDRAILDLLRAYYLDHQTDVLCTTYVNTYLEDDEDDTAIGKIVDTLHEAIEKAKEHKTYTSTKYICESMGNIISNAIKNKYPDMIEKSAYISPTKLGLEYIKKHPGLIISGTKDSYLDEDTIKELKSRPKENLIIIENAKHSLMVDDIYESIDIVKMVVKKIIDYLG